MPMIGMTATGDWTFVMKLILPVLLITILFPIVSCSSGPTKRVLFDQEILITPAGVSIKCDPPFQRDREAADLRFELSEGWDIPAEQLGIALKTGEQVDMQVLFLDSQGVVTRSGTFRPLVHEGRSFISASFNDLPRESRINEVKFFASEPLHCTRLEWWCWNPE